MNPIQGRFWYYGIDVIRYYQLTRAERKLVRNATIFFLIPTIVQSPISGCFPVLLHIPDRG